jgi:hypothetical protein
MLASSWGYFRHAFKVKVLFIIAGQIIQIKRRLIISRSCCTGEDLAERIIIGLIDGH